MSRFRRGQGPPHDVRRGDEEGRTDALLDALPIPAMVLTTDPLRVVVANERLRTTLALSEAEPRLAPYLSPDDLVGLRAAVIAVRHAPGTREQIEVGFADADGRLRALRLDLCDDPEGRGALATVIDVTTERAERARLLRSNGLLASFAQRVAHDLKGPLTLMAGHASALVAAEHGVRARPISPDDRARTLDGLAAAALRAGEQLDVMLRQALDTEKPISAVPLSSLLEWLDSLLALELHAARASLTCTTSLRQASVDIAVLRQAMLELCRNAIAYRDPAVELEVQVDLRSTGGGVSLTVTDNGRGIPTEHLDDVFELDVRLHPDVPGTGTGLHTLRDMVEGAGGTIAAVPRTIGARMIVWLPERSLSSSQGMAIVLDDHVSA